VTAGHEFQIGNSSHAAGLFLTAENAETAETDTGKHSARSAISVVVCREAKRDSVTADHEFQIGNSSHAGGLPPTAENAATAETDTRKHSAGSAISAVACREAKRDSVTADHEFQIWNSSHAAGLPPTAENAETAEIDEENTLRGRRSVRLLIVK